MQNDLKTSIQLSKDFYEQISKRRSVRHFSKNPVPREILLNAIRAAGTAPSGANSQPWHFALVTSQEIKNQIRQKAEIVEYEFYHGKASAEWLQDLKPFGTNHQKAYLSEASALIIVFTKNSDIREDGQKKRTYYPVESTGIAVGFLIAALHHAGISTLTHTPKPMSFVNQVLGFDKTFHPFMIVVAGYPEIPLSIPTVTKKALPQILNEF